MKFNSKFGLDEIVIRESNKNGDMVAERMMEVVCIVFEKNTVGYVCEDTQNGHRQVYSEAQLIGDKDFDQELGRYPKDKCDNSNENEV